MADSNDPLRSLEEALTELEERIDRLRALYDQYFLGFERTPPNVLRKDVDRRLYDLRKVQIRNSAARFRFNVLSQKYTTYSMHWARVCRQIEEGTYKRRLNRTGRKADAPEPQPREPSVEIHISEIEGGDLQSVIDAAAASVERAAASQAPRAARQVTLPPGARPLIVRKKVQDTQGSGNEQPHAARPSASPPVRPSAQPPSTPLASPPPAPASRPAYRPAALPTAAQRPRVGVRRDDSRPELTSSVPPPVKSAPPSETASEPPGTGSGSQRPHK